MSDNDFNTTSIEAIFELFTKANSSKHIVFYFQKLCDKLNINTQKYYDERSYAITNQRYLYQLIRSKFDYWKSNLLWSNYDKRASKKDYKRFKITINEDGFNNYINGDVKVLIIGCGPVGLRLAIECAFLGIKTVVVEKRDRFSRNNVLHLWPYTIVDLKSLGAKQFYGKFCAGSIDHISIRKLQCILLKVALLLGVEVHFNTSFEELLEPTDNSGWKGRFLPENHKLNSYEFNVVIGADGRRNTLPGFKRKEFRGKLAIGITANFINHLTNEEAKVQERSGVAFIFDQKFFLDLKHETGIDLENIVYYKDDTHYFVMTAKKQSLIEKNVIKKDYSDANQLLGKDNVNFDKLCDYAKEAAYVSTEKKLVRLDFAKNHYGQPDVAMFDFTSLFQAENASRITERKGYRLLTSLVGDSLLEPFWPTGTGIARGFLAAFDTAWMIRGFAFNKEPIELICERESIYQLLSQTTVDNMSKNYQEYSLDPTTRYMNLNRSLKLIQENQVRPLFDNSDKPVNAIESTSNVDNTQNRNLAANKQLNTLLTWSQMVTQMYGIKIENFTTSWKNGLAFCAIIHRFRPDLIEYTSIDQSDSVGNIRLVFDTLREHFNSDVEATPEEIANADVPNKFTILMILDKIYAIFRGQSFKDIDINTSIIESKLIPRPDKKRKNNDDDNALIRKQKAVLSSSSSNNENENNSNGNNKNKTKDSDNDKRSLKHINVNSLANMLKSKFESHKSEHRHEQQQQQQQQQQQSPQTSPQSPNLPQISIYGVQNTTFCHICEKKVYILERLNVMGLFVHGNCFRCDYCSRSLRNAQYSHVKDPNTNKCTFYCTNHVGMVSNRNSNISRKKSFLNDEDKNSNIETPINKRKFDGGGSFKHKQLHKTPERAEFEFDLYKLKDNDNDNNSNKISEENSEDDDAYCGVDRNSMVSKNSEMMMSNVDEEEEEEDEDVEDEDIDEDDVDEDEDVNNGEFDENIEDAENVEDENNDNSSVADEGDDVEEPKSNNRDLVKGTKTFSAHHNTLLKYANNYINWQNSTTGGTNEVDGVKSNDKDKQVKNSKLDTKPAKIDDDEIITKRTVEYQTEKPNGKDKKFESKVAVDDKNDVINIDDILNDTAPTPPTSSPPPLRLPSTVIILNNKNNNDDDSPDKGSTTSESTSSSYTPSSKTKRTFVCHICKQSASMSTRISLQGLLFHRDCMKCHVCGIVVKNVESFAKRYVDNQCRFDFYCMSHAPEKRIGDHLSVIDDDIDSIVNKNDSSSQGEKINFIDVDDKFVSKRKNKQTNENDDTEITLKSPNVDNNNNTKDTKEEKVENNSKSKDEKLNVDEKFISKRTNLLLQELDKNKQPNETVTKTNENDKKPMTPPENKVTLLTKSNSNDDKQLIVDTNLIRQRALERARLKSDEELGLKTPQNIKHLITLPPTPSTINESPLETPSNNLSKFEDNKSNSEEQLRKQRELDEKRKELVKQRLKEKEEQLKPINKKKADNYIKVIDVIDSSAPLAESEAFDDDDDDDDDDMKNVDDKELDEEIKKIEKTNLKKLDPKLDLSLTPIVPKQSKHSPIISVRKSQQRFVFDGFIDQVKNGVNGQSSKKDHTDDEKDASIDASKSSYTSPKLAKKTNIKAKLFNKPKFLNVSDSANSKSPSPNRPLNSESVDKSSQSSPSPAGGKSKSGGILKKLGLKHDKKTETNSPTLVKLAEAAQDRTKTAFDVLNVKHSPRLSRNSRTVKKQQNEEKRLEKQQREKRLRMSQEIQRKLDELDTKLVELEHEGVKLEKSICKMDSESDDRDKMEQDLYNLIHSKNLLTRVENELNIQRRALAIEDQLSECQQKLRKTINYPETEKSKDIMEAEKRTMEKIVELVEEKNQLVERLEQLRLMERQEDNDVAAILSGKGFNIQENEKLFDKFLLYQNII